jgi:hypothetical protein
MDKITTSFQLKLNNWVGTTPRVTHKTCHGEETNERGENVPLKGVTLAIGIDDAAKQAKYLGKKVLENKKGRHTAVYAAPLVAQLLLHLSRTKQRAR